MIEGLPVISSEEMQRIEKLAIASGENEQRFMEEAGAGVALLVEKFLITPQSSGKIYLLIGKGNKGGDAFCAGEILVQKGYTVIAYHPFSLSKCSPLCQKMEKRFRSAGGTYQQIEEMPEFSSKGLIIDGLLGTGFHGEVEGLLAEVIEGANDSGLPIFSIDIPSGVDGNTGRVETIAIKADCTIFLGLPKIGFFLEQGWEHTGEMVWVDFGLPIEFLQQAEALAYLINEQEAAFAFPSPKRTQHKYERGYVLAVAGSINMPGAALMSCLATLRAGAGIVRLFYPHEMREELVSAPYELIREGWDLKDAKRIFEEEKRAKALIIGPGMGRNEEAMHAIESVLAKTKLPSVLDADALYFLAQKPKMKLPKQVILTPHHGEMKRLLGDQEPDFSHCQKYVDRMNCTLVLKGAPTVIFHPHESPLIVPRGDPGMATAGTGDVLTGILGALLAQGLTPKDAAAVGVLLHAIAGEIAAEHETSYGVIATDLIHFIPEAIQTILSEGNSIEDD